MSITRGLSAVVVVVVLTTSVAFVCSMFLSKLEEHDKYPTPTTKEMIASLKNCEETFKRECQLSYSISPVELQHKMP